MNELLNIKVSDLTTVIQENGFNYSVTVGTPKNLLTLMNRQKKDFYSPGYPMIIVKKL